ncbi:MAG: LLM class flavin-dependent oxidoreductase, partial [Actinomycetota bacterium]|nr:LLM class flavin-dependent oxidoreductase [Actinomycetota bacterium]
ERQRQGERTGIALRYPLPWHDLEQVVATAEQTGYGALFLPEIAGRDAFATLTGLAPATPGMSLATGVATIVSRAARTTAMAAATVAERSGGRMILGLGTGPARRGALDTLMAYLETVRGLLAGRASEDGSRLSLVPPEQVPIWIAALGPRSMRLAGEIADGVLLNWCPPERVAVARQRIAEGAERAGRDAASVAVGVYIRACVGQGEAADIALRRAAGEYASFPAYRRQFEEVGLGKEAEAAANAGPDGAGVPSTFLDAVSLRGDAPHALSRLHAYREAGADLPIVYPVATLEPVSSILGTLFALAPVPAVED